MNRPVQPPPLLVPPREQVRYLQLGALSTQVPDRWRSTACVSVVSPDGRVGVSAMSGPMPEPITLEEAARALVEGWERNMGFVLEDMKRVEVDQVRAFLITGRWESDGETMVQSHLVLKSEDKLHRITATTTASNASELRRVVHRLIPTVRIRDGRSA